MRKAIQWGSICNENLPRDRQYSNSHVCLPQLAPQGHQKAGQSITCSRPSSGARTTCEIATVQSLLNSLSHSPQCSQCALQGYQKAGQEQYVREAIQWGADYLMKAHISVDSFVAQVGNTVIDGATVGYLSWMPTIAHAPAGGSWMQAAPWLPRCNVSRLFWVDP